MANIPSPKEGAKNNGKSKESLKAPIEPDSDQIDTLRDILFGEKSREHEKRFDDIYNKIRLEHEAWERKANEISQRLQELHQIHSFKLNELEQSKIKMVKMYHDFLSEWLKRVDTGELKSSKGR